MAKFVSLEHVSITVGGSAIRLKPGDIVDDALHPVSDIFASGVALVPLTEQVARVVALYNSRSRREGEPDGLLAGALAARSLLSGGPIIAQATTDATGGAFALNRGFEPAIDTVGVGVFDAYLDALLDTTVTPFTCVPIVSIAAGGDGLARSITWETSPGGTGYRVRLFDAAGAPVNGAWSIIVAKV